MGVLDFLFQGQAQPSTAQTVTGIPQYMSDYTLALLNKQNAIASQGYTPYAKPITDASGKVTGYGEAYPRLAQFTPEQQQAFDLTKQSTGMYTPSFATALDIAGQSTNANAFNAAQPTLQAATNINPLAAASPLYNQAATMDATQAAQPYLQGADKTFTGTNVSDYMNPYIQNVSDVLAKMGQRNLQENLLPAVDQNFIRSGQYGSANQQQAVGRALRDVQESILDKQAQLLNQGYTQAGQQFNADAARQAQLAQTAGGLTAQQMQNLASLGTQAGQLGVSEQGTLGNLGQVAGNLASQSARDQLSAAGQLGSLATAGQAANLKDLAALESVGQTQQAQNQKALDIAYQDFLEQRNYPQQQIANLNAAIRGLPITTTTNTSSSGNTYSASPLSQLAGSVSLANALSGVKTAAHGGHIKARNKNRRSTRGSGR